MKVVATKAGVTGEFYRQPGDVFEIPDEPRRAARNSNDGGGHVIFNEDVNPVFLAAMDSDKTVPQTFSSLWMKPHGI